jgi:AraC family cel operon transcriptional repressor
MISGKKKEVRKMKVYPQKNNVSDKTGYLCRYVKMETEISARHRHQYFEIFVVAKGTGIHIVNGVEQILNEGDLLFIRDFDIHDYKELDGKPFEFVNLAFSSEALYSMFTYLGENFPSRALLNAKMPPRASLIQPQKEALVYALLDLDRAESVQERSLKFRGLLISVFTKYFLSFSDTEENIPAWLSALYGKMQKPENFILGTARLFALAGKSREHVSREFTKFYGVTPSDFILNLRLTYAANLLVISNLSITDVCFESGFENLSWFYKAFGEKFGKTPSKYRREKLKGE